MTTSNLGMYAPTDNEVGWGTNVTNNFESLDDYLGGDSALTNVTVTNLAITSVTCASITFSSPEITISGVDIYFA